MLPLGTQYSQKLAMLSHILLIALFLSLVAVGGNRQKCTVLYLHPDNVALRIKHYLRQNILQANEVSKEKLKYYFSFHHSAFIMGSKGFDQIIFDLK